MCVRRRACVRGNLRSCPARALRADTADLWVRRPECLCSEDVRWRKLANHCMEGPHGKQGAFRGCTCPRGVLLEMIREVPSGTTLSWQCSRSTTNAISELLLFCVCVCVMRYIFISVLFSLGVRGVCVRCGYEDRIHFGRILEEL